MRRTQRQGRHRWTGELGRPIKWTGPTGRAAARVVFDLPVTESELEGAEKAKDRAFAEAHNERLRKLPLLAEHYGIDPQSPTSTFALLLQLACDTVPGFQIDYRGRGRGRGTTWTDVRYAELIADVEAVKRARNCGDSQACRVLVTARRYRTRYNQDGGSPTARAKALNNRLVEARQDQGFGTRLFRMMSEVHGEEFVIDRLIASLALDSEAGSADPRSTSSPEAPMSDKVSR